MIVPPSISLSRLPKESLLGRAWRHLLPAHPNNSQRRIPESGLIVEQLREPGMSSSALGSSRNLHVFPTFVTFLFLTFAVPLLADSHARIVRLSYVDGDVQLDKGDGRGFNAAYMNMPMSHGWK